MKSNFVTAPQPKVIQIRSKGTLHQTHKTSFNAGDLIPMYVQEVYPADTFRVSTSHVTRITSSLIKPIMDNLFMDMMYFFVPNRLVLETWVNVMGENTETKWKQARKYTVPQVTCMGGVARGSVLDYMGLPTDSPASLPPVSVLPARAFALIYNEWFRNQNVQDPVHITKSENSVTINKSDTEAPFSVDNIFGQVPKANKLHDYFTSCLPEPQKGDAVTIPVYGGHIPVKTSSDNTLVTGQQTPMFFRRTDTGNPMPNNSNYNVTLFTQNNESAIVPTSPSGEAPFAGSIYPSNLYINGESISSATVNQLRESFALQRMLERDARGGTRYTEILQSHFGVISPDSRLQRPEFLGGKRMPLNVTQVNQTSGSGSYTDTPLANVAGYSLTGGKAGFVKSFVEHGFVIGVACIRQQHTYQQGIEKFWFRKERTDFFDKVFQNLGERPVYREEIYAFDSSTPKTEVFGYNEAWADLRFRQNKISGQMQTGVDGSLDIWHLGDWYTNAPLLNSEFVKETDTYVDRVVSVPSSISDQFIVDFYHQNFAVRPIPPFSVPGLIDHN